MRAFALLLMVACGGDAPKPDTNDTTTGPTTTDTDTDLPGTDEGSVFLFETAPHFHDSEPNVTLAGLFVEDDLGLENLVQCIAFRESAWCTKQLPTDDGDYVVTETYADDMLEELVAIDVGPNIKFGPYTANKYEIGGQVAYFQPDLYGTTPPTGTADLVFGSEGSSWGIYEGLAVIDVPDQLVLSNPSVMDFAVFEAGKPVELRWNAGSSGEVYIAVLNGRENRLYKVADSGAFDLDLEDLGLWDGDAVEIRIGRWTTAEVDHEGHELTIHYQRDQKIFGSYRDFGGRVEIFPANTCNEAAAAPPLEPGNYWGDLGPLTNNNSPGLINSCTGFPAIGADGVYTLEVQDNEIVDIIYELPQGDASVYLLGICGQPATCIDGSDTYVGVGSQAEEISYHNQSGQVQNVSLVLDAAIWTNSVFTLDITSTQIISNVLVDTCLTAMSQGPIGAGSYVGDLNGFSNILDPALFGGPAAPGEEGLIQVELLPGESLQADVTMVGQDPVLYALYNCAVPASIAASSDVDATEQEQLLYTNQSPANELVYLVVDAAVSTGDYALDLVIQ